ncbi:MAG: Rieske 2Fe-2S domain-containing protein [Nevskia sp.]|nr:Rieske 2Fe-2S domain-containing protein [Nevskia sp.]
MELCRRSLAYIEGRRTEVGAHTYFNPVGDYSCPRQLAQERERLFLREPLLLAISGQLPVPGAYLTTDLGGRPLLLVRGDDGRVRAFLNVCRHRGTQVAAGCSTAAGKGAFTCPYHAWTYDTQGRLKAVNPAYAFEGVKREERGLVELPCAERHGLVWACQSPGQAIDVDALLGGLADEFEAYDLGRYTHFETRVLHKPFNWKLVLDTFLETWHIPVLHRKTVAPIFQPDVGVFDAFGRNGRMVIPRRSILELKEQPESQWSLLKHTAIVYCLYPNTIFVWQGDHVEIWRSYPDGDAPGRCVTEMSFYIPEPAETESARRHWQRNLELLLATVENEDFPLCAQIQRGAESGAQHYTTFGRNEPALSHFHAGIRGALGLPPYVPA